MIMGWLGTMTGWSTCAAAGTGVLVLCSAMSQQTSRQTTEPTSPAARTAAVRPSGSRPANATTQRPSHPTRAYHSGYAPGNAAAVGFGMAGNTAAANTFDSQSTAPQPTWELPRTVTREWELPSNVSVQPNPVQGNPQPASQAGVGYGLGFPYYAVADPYAFVDPTGSEPDMYAEQPATRHRPEYNARRSQAAQQPPSGQPEEDAAAHYSAPTRHESDFTDGLEHPEITLIFNDGKPPRKVRSYVMTASTMLVMENGRQTPIPLSELDGPATTAKNRAAGVDFTLPAAH